MRKFASTMVSVLLFSIFLSAQTVNLTAPNGGETWQVGSQHNITWTSNNLTTKIRLKLYKGGASFGPIITNEDNDGTYKWTIPASLNGHTLVTSSDYKVRIEAMDDSCEDWGDGNFSISTQSSSTPGTGTFQKTPANLKKMVKYTVEIIKPKAGTKVKEGGTLHVRWRSNYQGAWKIGLFRDGKTKKADLSGSAQHSGNLHQVMCVIPKGVSAFPFRKFKVRVGTPNPMSKIYAWSPTITIMADQEIISRGLYPSERHDCGKGKHQTYQYGGGLDGSGTSTTYKRKTGSSRVGYEHHYKKSGAEWSYLGYIFRSWIKFDLADFIGKPGIVKTAYLRLDKHEHKGHPGLAGIKHACNRVIKLTGGYSGSNCLSLPGDVVATIDPHSGKSYWKLDLRSTVRQWISHPETNFGLLLAPYKENYEKGNHYCVTYYKTKLVVEYVVSEE
jgi:hypothetical protein